MKNLENDIKNINFPLLLIFIITILDINDNITKIFIKIYLKYHHNLIKDKKKIFINKIKTYEILNDFENICKKQSNLLKKIKKIKKKYTNKFFWKKDIEEQANYLEKLFNSFLSLFDCSKSPIILFHKLETLVNSKEKNIIYHSNLIYDRLIKIYQLLGFKFFKNHKISIITELEFCDLDFNGKINFFKHIFSKINYFLKKYMNIFYLYNLNQKELIAICNINEIKISIDSFDSELDYNTI